MSKILSEKIEELVGDAYTIGHAHGQNAFRTKPKMVNRGWGKCSEKIIKLFEEEKQSIISKQKEIFERWESNKLLELGKYERETLKELKKELFGEK